MRGGGTREGGDHSGAGHGRSTSNVDKCDRLLFSLGRCQRPTPAVAHERVAQPVTYRSPRLINPVSVTFVALLVAAVYAGYEFVRVSFLRQEAYRVLEETSSTFSGRRTHYLREARDREALRTVMDQQLVSIGVRDPERETWVEVEPARALFGVVYTEQYHWPFDVLPPIERETQVEHELSLPPG